jgi:hypothetical protein
MGFALPGPGPFFLYAHTHTPLLLLLIGPFIHCQNDANQRIPQKVLTNVELKRWTSVCSVSPCPTAPFDSAVRRLFPTATNARATLSAHHALWRGGRLRHNRRWGGQWGRGRWRGCPWGCDRWRGGQLGRGWWRGCQ